jgi:hypothetical protein
LPKVFEFEFRLTSFAIDGKYMSVEEGRHLPRFLMIHKDTLETVRLNNLDSDWPYSIYEFIWDNLPHVKHVDMRVFELANYTEDGQNEKWSRPVPIESMTFYGEANDEDISSLTIVLNRFPDIKCLNFSKLKLSTHWNDIFCHISNELHNLTVLHMPESFEQDTFDADNIYFPKLEEFSMLEIKDKRMSLFFCRHSNTLKKISFKWTNQDADKLALEEIMKIKDPELTLKMSPSNVMSLFDYHEIDLDNLWALKLNVGWKKFSYKFPDDEYIWKYHKCSCLNSFYKVLENLTDYPISGES